MNDKTFAYCLHCKSLNKVALGKIKDHAPVCGFCHSPLSLHQLVSEVDHEGLTKLIKKSDLPVIVDFWAPWCGPCRVFGPTFEKISNSFGGKVVFVKINTEANPQASTSFNIRGIPTVAVFKNGAEMARQSGALDGEGLKHWLNQYS